MKSPYRAKAKIIFRIINHYYRFKHIPREKLERGALLAVQGASVQTMQRTGLTETLCRHLYRLAKKQREREAEKLSEFKIPLYTTMPPLKFCGVELVV